MRGAGLPAAGLLDGQRQEAQLRAQLPGAIDVTRPVVGEDRDKQGLRLGWVQDIQADGHGGGGPAGGSPTGDQVPAGRYPGKQRRDVSWVGYVVQD